MNNHRFLENKFYNEIIFHIYNALPNLKKFYQFKESTDYEDTNLSFDLVFNMNFTISVRIRKNKYIAYNDLTIRSKSLNNGKTEINKIMEGKAQIYFYAYMNKQENELVKIRISDIDSIRILTNKKKYIKKTNNDGTEFFAYKFNQIQKTNGAIYKFDKNYNYERTTIL